ncbi:MAG: hypothetical protein FJ109_04820 [Deltaproteobacteria bacterium]|nr:hypothetical protein [Deltaproteobacteria bacterium]
MGTTGRRGGRHAVPAGSPPAGGEAVPAAPILLTGMPGSGKSTVGKVLARLLGRPFMDLDDAYEARYGVTPAQTIRRDGEERFRSLESKLLFEALGQDAVVLACGGGTLVRERNLLGALERGFVVYLEAPPDVLAVRLGDERRHPLLAARMGKGLPGRLALEVALRSLLEEREHFYEHAHLTVETRGLSPFQAAMIVADHVRKARGGKPDVARRQAPPRGAVPYARSTPSFHDVEGGREGVLPLGPRSYPVRISRVPGFGGLGTFLDEVLPTQDRFVLIDEHVLGLYEQPLRRALRPGPVRFIPLPSGEAAKSLARTEECLERLLLSGATRGSAIVAVGGGSTLDAAGFAASIYMRSIPVVHVPTTLLAALDASIGGKNGVNLRPAKNIAGTFFQPRGVFVPLQAVGKEIQARGGQDGAAELVKTCLIAGVPFDRIRSFAGRDGRLRRRCLAEAVELAAACKMAIVSRDEHEEKGERVLLNLGHTFAHMAETASSYRLSHGRAVAWGLVVAARVSVGLGMARAGLETEVEGLCRVFGLWPPPLELPRELLQAPLLDKKRREGTLPLVLFEGMGRPVVTRFPEEEARKLLLTGMYPILDSGA